MDKPTYFQSVYEAQFALGKKMGAAVSAQILALWRRFFSAALTGIFAGGPLWALHPTPGQCCSNGPADTPGTVSNRGLIRARSYNREMCSRVLFEREAPLTEAWHLYESRDSHGTGAHRGTRNHHRHWVVGARSRTSWASRAAPCRPSRESALPRCN